MSVYKHPEDRIAEVLEQYKDFSFPMPAANVNINVPLKLCIDLQQRIIGLKLDLARTSKKVQESEKPKKPTANEGDGDKPVSAVDRY